MTPKSLLRHPLARSTYEEMASGTRFRSVIHDDESSLVAPQNVKKLLICSGKVYFDLLERKLKDKRNDIAITRVEQVLHTAHATCHTSYATRRTSHLTTHTRRRSARFHFKGSVRQSIAILMRKFLGFRFDFAFARLLLVYLLSFVLYFVLSFWYILILLSVGGAKESRSMVLYRA